MFIAMIIIIALAMFHTRKAYNEMTTAISQGYGNVDFIHARERLLWVRILLAITWIFALVGFFVY